MTKITKAKTTKIKLIATTIGLSVLLSPLAVHANETNIINYTVKGGDTLYNISMLYNTTIQDIKTLNSLTSDIIYTGESIKVHNLNATNYTIVSGDTLWIISQRFNITIDELVKLNNLSSTTLNIGQTLKIYTKTTPVITTYKVIAGDSLWKISIKFQITIDELMKFNNLSSTTINVGQILRLDNEAPIGVQTVNYKVVSGDNLWTLAQKYKTSIDAIMKSNMLIADYVMPTQVLTIPVNSTQVVNPVGIERYLQKTSANYGDVYTWNNAMRLWTVGTKGVVRDIASGKTFNVVYYGGSNHSDVSPITQEDTNIMKSIYGTWAWGNERPVVVTFTKGSIVYNLAASLTGMPHSTTDITNNGFPGHTDMYFYNSTSHNTNEISPKHQSNVLKASGR